jgi:sigma-B regulation protein RsbU (phosphoserine phosphatase)
MTKQHGKWRYHRLANEILVGNVIINILGDVVTNIIFRLHATDTSEAMIAHLISLDAAFSGFFLLAMVSTTLMYEWPIRRCLKGMLQKRDPDPNLLARARRRLLNEPFMIVALNLVLWTVGTLLFWFAGSPGAPYIGIACGMITVVLSFFWTEHIAQHNLVEVFFPRGGLSRVAGTIPIRLSLRLFALFLAASVTPLAFIHVTILKSRDWPSNGDLTVSELLSHLQKTVAAETVLFVLVAVGLTLLFIHNLKKPLQEITRVLSRVRKGHLEERVVIYTNDEFGFAGEVLNAMTDELQEKAKMRRSLNLAKEVQQSLLPRETVSLQGVDIAGSSVYCDETGGDYFDIFLSGKEGEDEQLSIIIADVSGHGISSALLMASVRASLRTRWSLSGGVDEVISDVNRRICEDFGDSGHFITLFYLGVDSERKRLAWIRAGHDPGLLYDPRTDGFEELDGRGTVLGLDEEYTYELNHRGALQPGQVIVLFTDGAWEARNPAGEVFGKERLKQVIREAAGESSARIVQRIIDAVKAFDHLEKPEDDITLVVVKAECGFP